MFVLYLRYVFSTKKEDTPTIKGFVDKQWNENYLSSFPPKIYKKLHESIERYIGF